MQDLASYDALQGSARVSGGNSRKATAEAPASSCAKVARHSWFMPQPLSSGSQGVSQHSDLKLCSACYYIEALNPAPPVMVRSRHYIVGRWIIWLGRKCTAACFPCMHQWTHLWLLFLTEVSCTIALCKCWLEGNGKESWDRAASLLLQASLEWRIADGEEVSSHQWWSALSTWEELCDWHVEPCRIVPGWLLVKGHATKRSRTSCRTRRKLSYEGSNQRTDQTLARNKWPPPQNVWRASASGGQFHKSNGLHIKSKTPVIK